jgi:hypothetical protein
MKRYVNKMSLLLGIQHPEAGCSCYSDFEMEEEFLCDLCLARLKKHRARVKHELRREAKHKYKKRFSES